MITYYDAVFNLVGSGIGGPIDGPISSFHFPDGVTPPTEEQVQAKLKELKADYDAKQYQRDRAIAYDPIREQLDQIYHKGLTEWKKTIKAIKDKHPKS